MVAATLPVPPLPLPPDVSRRRISAAAASPTCPILRIGPRLFYPFVDYTFRHGRNTLSHFRIHFRIRSGVHAEFAIPERLRVFRDGFECRGGTGRRSRSLARAGAGVGALGGNSGSFNNWAGAVEGGGLQEFLIVVLKNLEVRRKRRMQSAPWPSVIIGTVILAGILASRSAVGRVFAPVCCATLVIAVVFRILVDDEKLQLICERFQLFDVRARDQLHAFSEAIAKAAHHPHRFLPSRLSSSFPTLAGECEGDKVKILTSGGSVLIPEARRISIPGSSTKYSGTKDLALYGKPDVTKVATYISLSIAHLIIVITTAEMAASHADSRNRLESGIQDPCRELQSVEAALPAQQNEFHSKEDQSLVEAPDSEATIGVFPSNINSSKGLDELIVSKVVECGGSDVRKEEIVPIFHSPRPAPNQRTSGQQSSMKCTSGNEAYKTPTFHESRAPLSAHLESIKETLQVSPPILRIWSIPSIVTHGAMVEKALPSEDVKSNIGQRRRPIESDIGATLSNSEGDDFHLVDIHKCLPATDSPVKDQGHHSNHLSRSRSTQVIETRRVRPSYPDPWLNDCTSQPIEKNELGHEHWAARSSHESRNDDGSQLLDLIVIVDEESKAETPRRDVSGNGRGVNRNGSIDFWGKNAGIIIKTCEQRGTLTKSKATGKGSSFGSVDDMGDDRPQERGRSFWEEEQQKLLRRGLSSSVKAGQPWDGKQQPGASGRDSVRGDQRMGRHSDASLAAGEYGRGEADVTFPEILIRDTDLEVTKNSPLLIMDRWADDGTSQSRESAVPRGDLMSPAPVGGRVSPSREIGGTMMSNNGPSKSREGEENSRQPIIETGVVNEKNYNGSKRVWDSAPDSEQEVYRVPEDGSRNGRVTPDSLGYNQSQPETSPLMDTLQQSKQTQTLKLEKYLDEAEALVEQGMQGLEGRIEVGVAERMLDEAANLLEKASEIYPADLIAVGQWGNSLLVHGQLKLKLSQQLRDMLLSPKPSSPLKRGEGAIVDRERESMESTLQEVCEECEELLVDAGRKFRRALNLDKSDVRALYNWGLALCYRGQLISQEDGERALEDADKVYLAAIDKFEAILGISQDHAAGALLNWGLAMLDRSRLRDMGDKERVQLLLQAKELFQDAVRVDPDYGQARGAVVVCSAELKELQGFESLQRQDIMERPNRNWWQKGG